MLFVGSPTHRCGRANGVASSRDYAMTYTATIKWQRPLRAIKGLYREFQGFFSIPLFGGCWDNFGKSSLPVVMNFGKSLLPVVMNFGKSLLPVVMTFI